MPIKEHTTPFAGNPLPWVIGVLLIFGLAVAGGIYWNRTNKVTSIDITGLHYISKKDVREHLHIPVGTAADSLDYKVISQNIKKNPYVKDTRFHLSPSGTLTINITERTPIAMLVDGSKRIYIDQTGNRLKKHPGQTVNVPLLYGFSIKSKPDTLQTKAFKQTILFLDNLHQNKAADATISEVVWNANQGIIALTNTNGVKVIFGKGNFEKRLRNYNAFFRSIIRKEGINQFHSIDMRFEGQIVTRED